MAMQFKTKRNTYGHRYYLGINVENRTFTRNDPHMITEGIEISKRDMENMIKELRESGFMEAQ